MARLYCILADPMTNRNDDAEAGAREPFLDAALYDYEYRHRRADITFYQRLVKNRMDFGPGPILDLACGSGRMLVPLIRAGHRVCGVDRSQAMLAQARQKLNRMSPAHKSRAQLIRADLRAFAMRSRFSFALCAFHSIQHLYTDTDLLHFLRNVHASLVPGGWLAFDVLPPRDSWLTRDSQRRYGRTRLRHPKTQTPFLYSYSHTYQPDRQLLHMRLFYQPIDAQGGPQGAEQCIRLCHRQLWPEDCGRLLRLAGFQLLESFADWDGHFLADFPQNAPENIYLAMAKT